MEINHLSLDPNCGIGVLDQVSEFPGVELAAILTLGAGEAGEEDSKGWVKISVWVRRGNE